MALGDPFERREFSSNAVATTLDGAMGGTGAVTPSIADATGWPDGSDGPFYALFNGAEICLVTSRSSMTLTIASGGRGQLGTSAANHASGTSVVFVATSRDLDEANRIVNILGNGTSGYPVLGGGTSTAPAYARLGVAGLSSAVAGAGLTGGDGSALAVGAGTGITANANDVAVDFSTAATTLAGVGLDPNGTALDVDLTECTFAAGTVSDLTLIRTSINVTYTSGRRDARYFQLGKLVIAFFDIEVATATNGGSGVLTIGIGSLPAPKTNGLTLTPAGFCLAAPSGTAVSCKLEVKDADEFNLRVEGVFSTVNGQLLGGDTSITIGAFSHFGGVAIYEAA